jgi:hypothetical protein
MLQVGNGLFWGCTSPHLNRGFAQRPRCSVARRFCEFVKPAIEEIRQRSTRWWCRFVGSRRCGAMAISAAPNQCWSVFYSSPWWAVENGFIESFNGRLRDECLRLNGFHRCTMRGRSRLSSANITITNGRTAHWRTVASGVRGATPAHHGKRLVHRWGAHSRVP